MSPNEVSPVIDEDLKIISLVENGDWRTILSEHSRNRFLPWIWPSSEDLEFIAEAAKSLGADKVVSIGCGSALLEWLIHNVTGMEVKCVEVDKSWWSSKYSTCFLPLEFCTEFAAGYDVASASDALLFCYFIDEAAFVDYLRWYRGFCVIVIGPGPERGTHTNPTPFQLPASTELDWELHSMREVQSGKDFIAVFRRRDKDTSCDTHSCS